MTAPRTTAVPFTPVPFSVQFLGNARKTNGRFHKFPVKRSHLRAFSRTVLGADCMGTAAGVPEAQRSGYVNDGKSFDAVGNHGWTLDPPRLTDRSDRGTGDAGSPRTAVDPRHRGKANAVFCDGHAETREPEQLGYGIGADGAYVNSGPGVHNALFSGSGNDNDPPDLPR